MGVSNLLASLGHAGRRRVVLGHTVNALQHVISKKSYNILSKFTTLCWAAFTAILGCMRPTGRRLDIPNKHFILFDTIVNGIVFLVSFLNRSLLM